MIVSVSFVLLLGLLSCSSSATRSCAPGRPSPASCSASTSPPPRSRPYINAAATAVIHLISGIRSERDAARRRPPESSTALCRELAASRLQYANLLAAARATLAAARDGDPYALEFLADELAAQHGQPTSTTPFEPPDPATRPLVGGGPVNRRTRRARRRLRRGDARGAAAAGRRRPHRPDRVDRAGSPGSATATAPNSLPFAVAGTLRLAAADPARQRAPARGGCRWPRYRWRAGCAGRGSRRCCARSNAATPSPSPSCGGGWLTAATALRAGHAAAAAAPAGRHDRGRRAVVGAPAPPRQGPRRTHPRRLAATSPPPSASPAPGSCPPWSTAGAGAPASACHPAQTATDLINSDPGAGIRARHPPRRRPGRARPRPRRPRHHPRPDHRPARPPHPLPHRRTATRRRSVTDPIPLGLFEDAQPVTAPAVAPARPARRGRRRGQERRPQRHPRRTRRLPRRRALGHRPQGRHGAATVGGLPRPARHHPDRSGRAARRRRRRPRRPRPADGRRRLPAVAAHRRWRPR